MDRLKSVTGRDKPLYAGAPDAKPSSSKDRLKSLGGPVAGWMGKSADSSPAAETYTRPITDLKDPASFGPPPRHYAVRGHGDAAASPSQSPPPIAERESQQRESSPSNYHANLPARTGTPRGAGPPPPIPPRLPAREGSFPKPREVTDEDIRKTGGLNTSALGRLGKAGISVPGFNSSSPQSLERPPPPPRVGQMGAKFGFGQLASSQFASNSERPAEGPTFAEKQSAARTANNLFNDPSRVSLSDARSAAKTAQNFQKRHGDQVATGLYAAQGANDKLSQLRGKSISPPLPPRSPASGSPSITSAIAGKKKPPPPPPKKKPSFPVNLSQPPPIPSSSRPLMTVTSSIPLSLSNGGLPTSMVPEIPVDLDLDLGNAWFSSNPPKLPPTIEVIKDKFLNFSTSWTRSASGRTKHTLVIAIRYTLNMTTTKVKLTWDASAPCATVTAIQRHYPAPERVDAESLESSTTLYGEKVLAWAQSQIGQQVGNGECWTLAHDALQAVPGAFVSQGLTHGACIFAHLPPATPSPGSTLQLKAGDILQFWRAQWEERDANGRVVWSKMAGDPDHTAVVIQTEGDVVQVLEQNVGGVKRVQRGEYRLGENGGMSDGIARAFRPVGEDYGCFNAEWEQ